MEKSDSSISEKETSLSDISLSDLIENAQKALRGDDLKGALFYLNLIKTAKTKSEDVSSSLVILSLYSVIYSKLGDHKLLISVARKIFKLIKGNKLNSFPPELLIIFVKILLKVSVTLEEKNSFDSTLYACWFLYTAKNIYDNQNLQGEDELYETITNSFPRVMGKISENLDSICQEMIKSKGKLKSILDYFLSHEKKKTEANSANQKFYLINSTWISNMIVFIKTLLETREEEVKESQFNLNNICLLFFDGEEEEDRKELLGSYPGAINNFLLTRARQSLTDPEDTPSNIFLSKAARENSDFIIVPENIYSEIEGLFGRCEEPIERVSRLLGEEVKVLYLNETLRKDNKDLINVNKLQISKWATYSELESKLQRCFIALINNSSLNASQFDFKVFRHNRGAKEVFSLTLSYINRNKSFKLMGREIKKSDTIDKSISDLKFTKEDVLIVEVIPKNMIVKPFLRLASETLSCSLCSIKVDSQQIIHCDNCTSTVYCSPKCKESDLVHSDYHKKIASLYKKKMTKEEISQIKLSHFFDSSSKGGLVGLKNFGNTDFMNAAIQCLSHCDDLTKYFLSKSFTDEINKTNRFGTEGRVAKVYYDLMHELWIGSKDSIAPWDFKNLFTNFLKNFGAGSHADAKDVVLFLLTRLHEDLNRVKDKSAEIVLPSENAEANWKEFLSNDNSIITDNFYGQMRTQMRCPSCKKVDTHYDPFLFLPLAIPDQYVSKIRFKVFTNNFEFKYFYVEVFGVDKATTVLEVKNKIKEKRKYAKSEFDAVVVKNKAIDKLLNDEDLVHDYVFTKVDYLEEDFVDIEIVFYEVNNSFTSKGNKGDWVTFFVSPCSFYEESYLLMLRTKKFRALTYPKAFSINKKSKVKDLFMTVYKYYRRAMNDQLIHGENNEVDTTYYEEFYKNLENKDFIEKDFDRLFLGEDELSNDESKRLNNPNGDGKTIKHFELNLLNNIPESNSYFFRKAACEYCNRSGCNFCKLEVKNLDTKIYEFYAKQKVNRPFFLVADFSSHADGFHKYYEEFNEDNHKADLTLYDVLDHFKKEEKLGKEELWKCPYCNKKLEAFRKKDIHKAPNYLLLGFKRFKLKGHKNLMELVNNKKNDTYVYYPEDELDLSHTVLTGCDEAVYELVAVCGHTGGLQGGVFNALGKQDAAWYNYKDETVKAVEKMNDVVGPEANAYLLFYKRKDVKREEEVTVEATSSIN